MSEKILVPTLGECITEATVSKWLKSSRVKVTADEPIVELETDKVNVEVPSPSNGVLESISVKEGETVNVGALLGMINGASTKDVGVKETKNYSPPKKKQISKEKKEQQSSKKVSTQPSIFEKEEEEEVLILNDIKEKSGIDEEPLILDNPHEEEKVLVKCQRIKQKSSVSPAARKMATEKNIDLDKVRGLRKTWSYFERRCYELNGCQTSSI